MSFWVRILFAVVLAAVSIAPGMAQSVVATTAMSPDACAGIARPQLPADPSDDDRARYRAAEEERAKSDWPNRCRYHASNLSVSRPTKVVFLGDSITQFWVSADPALFSNGVIGRGISGQTAPQVLLRFYPDVVALSPTAVHIMVGTNDVAGNTGPTTVEAYRDDIRAMVALARANRVRVILASVPPAAGFYWRPQYQPAMQLKDLNSWLRSFARKEKLVFADYHSVLAAADGGLRAEFTEDGVHPNAAGYRAMGAVVRQALRKSGIR